MKIGTQTGNTNSMMAAQAARAKQAAYPQNRGDVDLGVDDKIDPGEARTMVMNAIPKLEAEEGGWGEKHGTIMEVLRANPNDRAMVSDTDEMLLLKINFPEKVKISQIGIRADKPPEGCENDMSRPQSIKVFVDMPDLCFPDVEEETTFKKEFEMSKDEEYFQLPGHHFGRVKTLQIFVQTNSEDTEHTFLNRVAIKGHLTENYHTNSLR